MARRFGPAATAPFRRGSSADTNGALQTDVSAAPPAAAPKRPPSYVERAQAAQAATVASHGLLLQMLRAQSTTNDLLKAPPLAGVLGQMTQLIPSSGFLHRQWANPFQSVMVANFGAAPVTLWAGTPLASAPSVGTGVSTVGGGMGRLVNMRGRSLTIYGTPGTPVELAVYSSVQSPAYGAVSATAADETGIVSQNLIPAGTTATTTATLTNTASSRLHLVLSVTALGGGASVVLTVNAVSASGFVYPLFTPSPTATATGVSAFKIGPGFTPIASETANDLVPPTVQVTATPTGGSATYGLDATLGK